MDPGGFEVGLSKLQSKDESFVRVCCLIVADCIQVIIGKVMEHVPRGASIRVQAKELQNKYEKQMKMVRDDLELQRKQELHQTEERKNAHIRELMRKHRNAFTEIKNYYNDITSNNLDLIKTLKEDVADMKKKEALNEKLMYEISNENKRLSEPLNRALKVNCALNAYCVWSLWHVKAHHPGAACDPFLAYLVLLWDALYTEHVCPFEYAASKYSCLCFELNSVKDVRL